MKNIAIFGVENILKKNFLIFIRNNKKVSFIFLDPELKKMYLFLM